MGFHKLFPNSYQLRLGDCVVAMESAGEGGAGESWRRKEMVWVWKFVGGSHEEENNIKVGAVLEICKTLITSHMGHTKAWFLLGPDIYLKAFGLTNGSFIEPYSKYSWHEAFGTKFKCVYSYKV